ncbi:MULTISPECIES: phosphate ABC transporter ATP-binding protein [Actibacterium]|uniref:Phosphate transport system ATP-binding protein n=1 Tax=Actibacterium naphthalenivorans TaxID=1614693 RepID=A0A840CNE8_9RHOB|nr:phosphate ABC transporter ATP-binding protein [Actibacterium naphthalenivorans]MBB4023487.1 phosphate transport system ATP-binding protein [Actibacterium naphthalenivorans]
MQGHEELPKSIYHPSGRNTDPIMEILDLSLWYGEKQALFDVNFDLYPSEILAFIGPSGCGKSTALKALNRMHDLTRDVRIEGRILMDGHDIYAPDIDPPLHRKRFGWVAQKPNPFTTSVYDNVAYGARIHGLTRTRADLDEHVETCLRRADLWEEVKDHLHSQAGTALSGGQQQRLCIARALATEPEVLLMDEPTGSIDPIATARVEELMLDLKKDHSVVVVTHSMMEARRVSDRVAYFHLGHLLELGPTMQIFEHAETRQASEFIRGKFG